MLEININTAYALALSFIVVIAIGPWLIPQLHKLKFGQAIREEGPQSHQAKSGTPTMGGMMIILGLVLSTLVFANHTVEIMLAVFVVLPWAFWMTILRLSESTMKD